MKIRVGIITVSDRASRGQYEDLSGPALKEAAGGHGWEVVVEALISDDQEQIQQAIKGHIAKGAHLVLTTGGTGVGPRDVTPEAVREIAERELPGFGELMRSESLKITPNAILSRCLAVSIDRALTICLPGSPRGSVECLGFVAGVIPHCLEELHGTAKNC